MNEEMDSTAVREQRQVPHTEVHAEVGHHEAPAHRDVVFETRDLSVYYGDFRAVRDVNLTIYRNHITALIGPSGCGKTTFIRCLNRMNDLIETARVEGEIKYHGVNLYDKKLSLIHI